MNEIVAILTIKNNTYGKQKMMKILILMKTASFEIYRSTSISHRISISLVFHHFYVSIVHTLCITNVNDAFSMERK